MITNTSKQPPELHLLDAALVGSSEAIVASERRGAAEMSAQRSQLPSDGSDDPAWAAMGVLFGAGTEGDPLFRAVTLPEGWRIQRTEHDMWTDLLDRDGRKRGAIFYKAAFYDRRAYIRAECRYVCEIEYRDFETRVVLKDKADSMVLRAWPWRVEEDYPTNNNDRMVARRELAAQFPNAEDPTAYWDGV